MRVNFGTETRSYGCFAARVPYHFCIHRALSCVSAVAGKQPRLRLPPEAAPVQPQLIQQFRAQHDLAVLMSLSSLDVDHHPLAVDVADFQMRQFSPPESRCI